MKRAFLLLAVLLVAISMIATPVAAKDKIKIGVVYSLTGAFALAGAEAGYRGSMIAIDMWNEKGGVGGKYEIEAVTSDAQSSPDVAIREAERLIDVEKVPIILGLYSSSIAVPLAPICDKKNTIMWVTISISDKVVQGRHQKYVFRPQPMASQWGESSIKTIADNLDKFGAKDAKDVKVAVIYEDGPYGTGVQASNITMAKQYGMQVVLHEGYNHKAKDLSSLILKLKAANPDAILHTGYYPDIVLFLRQAREFGLKSKVIIGHGAGYANFENLQKQLGPELVSGVIDIDPAPAQNLDLNKIAADVRPVIQDFLKRYGEKFQQPSPPSHATQGFGHTWMLLKTLDLCVEKYGEPTPDNIRKAALEINIPEGGSPCGYGLKFAPPEDEYAGQNKLSFPIDLQWLNQKVEIVWPNALKSMDPVIPMPDNNPLSTAAK